MGGIRAARSGLVWEWFRVLDEMVKQPKILLMENVIGLLVKHNGENYSALHMALVERGYQCGAIVLNASLFLPQSRPRVFIIAVHNECQIPSNIISDSPCWFHNKNAIEIGMRLPNWIWWSTEKPSNQK